MNVIKTSFKTSVLSAAASLVLGISVNTAQAAVATTGNNFSMLNPTVLNKPTGGTNDVAFTWNETFHYRFRSAAMSRTLRYLQSQISLALLGRHTMSPSTALVPTLSTPTVRQVGNLLKKRGGYHEKN